MTWLQELFTPIARLFRHMEELRSQAQACFEQPDAAVEVVSAESPRVPGVAPTHDGDVTDAIAAQCTAKEKVELVAKLTKDSEDQQKTRRISGRSPFEHTSTNKQRQSCATGSSA